MYIFSGVTFTTIKNASKRSSFKKFNGNSTQKRDYQSYPFTSNKPFLSNTHLQKSNFNFGNKVFQGTTTYMNDYTIKPLPNNNDDCWC